MCTSHFTSVRLHVESIFTFPFGFLLLFNLHLNANSYTCVHTYILSICIMLKISRGKLQVKIVSRVENKSQRFGSSLDNTHTLAYICTYKYAFVYRYVCECLPPFLFLQAYPRRRPTETKSKCNPEQRHFSSLHKYAFVCACVFVQFFTLSNREFSVQPTEKRAHECRKCRSLSTHTHCTRTVAISFPTNTVAIIDFCVLL